LCPQPGQGVEVEVFGVAGDDQCNADPGVDEMGTSAVGAKLSQRLPVMNDDQLPGLNVARAARPARYLKDVAEGVGRNGVRLELANLAQSTQKLDLAAAVIAL
jgi:hypothetical protein